MALSILPFPFTGSKEVTVRCFSSSLSSRTTQRLEGERAHTWFQAFGAPHYKLRHSTAYRHTHQSEGGNRFWHLHVKYPGAIGSETRKVQEEPVPSRHDRFNSIVVDSLLKYTIFAVTVRRKEYRFAVLGPSRDKFEVF